MTTRRSSYAILTFTTGMLYTMRCQLLLPAMEDKAIQRGDLKDAQKWDKRRSHEQADINKERKDIARDEADLHRDRAKRNHLVHDRNRDVKELNRDLKK